MSSDQKDSAGAGQGQVDLSTLSVSQLRTLQSRLSSELEHLTNSHAKLRTAQTKFRDCIRSINEGVTDGDDKAGNGGKDEILVPLTSSLYVKGKMADRAKVLVDVGTGFFVEKTKSKATEFYNTKVEELGTNLQDLGKVVQGKSGNLKAVEEAIILRAVLRQKVLNGEGDDAPAGSEGAKA